MFLVTSQNRHVCANSTPLTTRVTTLVLLPCSAVFCVLTAQTNSTHWGGDRENYEMSVITVNENTDNTAEFVGEKLWQQSNLYKHMKKSRRKPKNKSEEKSYKLLHVCVFLSSDQMQLSALFLQCPYTLTRWLFFSSKWIIIITIIKIIIIIIITKNFLAVAVLGGRGSSNQYGNVTIRNWSTAGDFTNKTLKKNSGCVRVCEEKV